MYNKTRIHSGKAPAKGRVIDLTKGAKKTMQPYQAYYTLYKEKLKPVIKERYDAALKVLPEGEKAPDRFGFGNEVVRELLRHETPAVKERVEQYRLNGEQSSDDSDDEAGKKRKARVA